MNDTKDTPRCSPDVSSLVSPMNTSPISVLTLSKEALLKDGPRRLQYSLVHTIARLLPAIIVYGGTAGLLVCAVCQYRWGVLLSLTLYSFYMFHLAFTTFVFAILGLLKVLVNSNENWKARYHYEVDLKERQGQTSTFTTQEDSHGDLGWNDVLHIVMIPSYDTPMSVLEETLLACEKYDQASTHLGICLAFEEREQGIANKAAALQEQFENRFKFLFTTFHPPDLPQHLPGKSSNECWAFGELCRELQNAHDIMPHDPRVVITVIDDDSELQKIILRH